MTDAETIKKLTREIKRLRRALAGEEQVNADLRAEITALQSGRCSKRRGSKGK